MMTNSYHIPVLLHTAVDALNINPQGTYVDVTFGGGGHSSLILSKLTTGKLFAFDRDPDAQKNIPPHSSLIFIADDFGNLAARLNDFGISKVDGILADLGVSSHQFNEGSRGFSFRFNSRLDMRMNPNDDNDAYNVVNTYAENELANVFYKFGEINKSRQAASRIVKARAINPIETTFQLQEVLHQMVPSRMLTGFMAQVFQALRIEVNKELESLENLLQEACILLNANGRLVVIAYHSLEDRMVKNYIKAGNVSGQQQKDFYGNSIRPLIEINKKPIVPDNQEIELNNRARSAKLRIAQKK